MTPLRRLAASAVAMALLAVVSACGTSDDGTTAATTGTGNGTNKTTPADTETPARLIHPCDAMSVDEVAAILGTGPYTNVREPKDPSRDVQVAASTHGVSCQFRAADRASTSPSVSLGLYTPYNNGLLGGLDQFREPSEFRSTGVTRDELYPVDGATLAYTSSSGPGLVHVYVRYGRQLGLHIGIGSNHADMAQYSEALRQLVDLYVERVRG